MKLGWPDLNQAVTTEMLLSKHSFCLGRDILLRGTDHGPRTAFVDVSG